MKTETTQRTVVRRKYTAPHVEIHACDDFRILAGTDPELSGTHKDGTSNGIATGAKEFGFEDNDLWEDYDLWEGEMWE